MNSFTIFLSSALMPKQLGMPLPGKKVLDCVLAAIYTIVLILHCIKCILPHSSKLMVSTSWFMTNKPGD